MQIDPDSPDSYVNKNPSYLANNPAAQKIMIAANANGTGYIQ